MDLSLSTRGSNAFHKRALNIIRSHTLQNFSNESQVANEFGKSSNEIVLSDPETISFQSVTLLSTIVDILEEKQY